jgi:release factor glutamine methyltransferase
MPNLVQHEREIILTTVLGISQTELLLAPKESFNKISADQKMKISEWTTRRLAGEPLQYITGRQVFLNHEYQVGPGVLIPRPETEVLVESVLTKLRRLDTDLPIRGFELGLGSGIISIELLSQLDCLQMKATDVSLVLSKAPFARIYAQINAENILGVNYRDRLEIVEIVNPDLTLEPVSGDKFDFIVSNPPYVDRADEVALDVLTHEPHGALYPLEQGSNFFYEALARLAPQCLKPGGFIALEIPHQRAEPLRNLFEASFVKVEMIKDLTSRNRVLIAYGSN